MYTFQYELAKERHIGLLRQAEQARLARAARSSNESNVDAARLWVGPGLAVLGSLLVAAGAWLQKRSNRIYADPCAEQSLHEAPTG